MHCSRGGGNAFHREVLLERQLYGETLKIPSFHEVKLQTMASVMVGVSLGSRPASTMAPYDGEGSVSKNLDNEERLSISSNSSFVRI